jgi:hypothetical protein
MLFHINKFLTTLYNLFLFFSVLIVFIATLHKKGINHLKQNLAIFPSQLAYLEHSLTLFWNLQQIVNKYL